jgi:Fe-S-cluster-containing dehydrogenase component
MAACPYDARFVHPDGFVDKCTLCVHRQDKAQPTACEEVCPTDAIVSGDADDRHSAVSERLRQSGVSVVKPEIGTQPNVYYLT